MKRIATMLASLFVCLLTLSGCGSAGSVPKPQQKTATIIFSTVSSAHTAPLLGIQLSAKLPAGTSIADISTALTGHNDTGRLFGSPQYSPATQTVTFAVVSPLDPIRFGEFAELKCDITSGVSLDQSSFEAINTPFPDLQMSSGSATATEDLTTKIPVRISVSFGY